MVFKKESSTKPRIKKPTDVKTAEDINAWEQYAGQDSSRADLLAQPWSNTDSSNVVPDGGEVLRIEDLDGGDLKVTEGGKSRIVKRGSGIGIKEYESGDTFNRTIYSEGGLSEGYINDQDRVEAMRQSVRMYRDDPMYRDVIDAFVYFVIGKGLKFKARDENPDVQKHLDMFWKENKMDGRDTDIVRRYLKFGEILIRYHKNGPNGVPAKLPRIRLVPFWRINDFKFDPMDPESLVNMNLSSYDLNGMSTGAPEIVPAEELQYVVNSENEAARGEPPFLVIMRACKWYADFVLNRVVLNRFRSSYVLFKKIKGSPGRTTGADSSQSNSTKKGLGGQMEKRLPKPGTVVTHNDAVEYDWKNPDTGAGDASQDGDLIRRYICAGSMVPEFIFGNVGDATRDNATTANSPFVRKVEFLQDLFEGVFGDMFKRVIEQGISTGALPEMSTDTKVNESGSFMKRVRKLLHSIGVKEVNADGDNISVVKIPTKTEI